VDPFGADTTNCGQQMPGPSFQNRMEANPTLEAFQMRKLIPVVGPLLAAVLAMIPIVGAILAGIVA
jgi:hypothetical protein